MHTSAATGGKRKPITRDRRRSDSARRSTSYASSKRFTRGRRRALPTSTPFVELATGGEAGYNGDSDGELYFCGSGNSSLQQEP
jgi:hypothetical protein